MIPFNSVSGDCELVTMFNSSQLYFCPRSQSLTLERVNASLEIFNLDENNTNSKDIFVDTINTQIYIRDNGERMVYRLLNFTSLEVVGDLEVLGQISKSFVYQLAVQRPRDFVGSIPLSDPQWNSLPIIDAIDGLVILTHKFGSRRLLRELQEKEWSVAKSSISVYKLAGKHFVLELDTINKTSSPVLNVTVFDQNTTTQKMTFMFENVTTLMFETMKNFTTDSNGSSSVARLYFFNLTSNSTGSIDFVLKNQMIMMSKFT